LTSHIQFAGGANDGFVRSISETVPGGDPTVAMGYWDAEDLPFYAGLAQTFPLADRWYCSLLGPTFPNRRFLIAATANGLIDDVFAGMIDYPRTGTIFDLLDRNGISWANYHHVGGAKAAVKRVPLHAAGSRALRALRLTLVNFSPYKLKVGLDNLQFTSDLYPLGAWRCWRHLRHIDRFFEDCDARTLPAVSIVDPDFRSCSEENPQNIQIGEGFAAAVINAVMNGRVGLILCSSGSTTNMAATSTMSRLPRQPSPMMSHLAAFSNAVPRSAGPCSPLGSWKSSGQSIPARAVTTATGSECQR
jgi:phospholipase C